MTKELERIANDVKRGIDFILEAGRKASLSTGKVTVDVQTTVSNAARSTNPDQSVEDAAAEAVKHGGYEPPEGCGCDGLDCLVVANRDLAAHIVKQATLIDALRERAELRDWGMRTAEVQSAAHEKVKAAQRAMEGTEPTPDPEPDKLPLQVITSATLEVPMIVIPRDEYDKHEAEWQARVDALIRSRDHHIRTGGEEWKWRLYGDLAAATDERDRLQAQLKNRAEKLATTRKIRDQHYNNLISMTAERNKVATERDGLNVALDAAEATTKVVQGTLANRTAERDNLAKELADMTRARDLASDNGVMQSRNANESNRQYWVEVRKREGLETKLNTANATIARLVAEQEAKS